MQKVSPGAEHTRKGRTDMAEETNFSQGEAEEVKYQERKRLLFFGLPWTFTKYTISQDMITVDEGLIKVEENDCYMYKVQDVKLTATLPERIFGMGTIICYTGDVTDKELRLSHIKHAKEVQALQMMWICRKSRCFYRAQECVPGKGAMRGLAM